MDSKITFTKKTRAIAGSGFFILAFGILLLAFFGFKPAKKYFIIDSSSAITIEGKANVIDYECAITNHKWGDTIKIEKYNDSICTFSKNTLKIPVLSFACDNEVMTDDFKETLNSDKFPTITLIVNELVFKCGKPNTTMLKANLSIAGVKRAIEIQCQRSNLGSGMIITGAKKLTFSEFKLVPPEKFFGMVKVEDQITIFFDLHLK